MSFGRRNTMGVEAVAEQRRGERQVTHLLATIRRPAGEPFDAVIDQLSTSGFRARVSRPVQEGMLIRVRLPNGRSPHARVARVDEEIIGCEFTAQLASNEAKSLTD